MKTTHSVRQLVGRKALTPAAALLALAVGLGTVPFAVAQVTPITPGAGAKDFKPLFAKQQDLVDGKRLAETTCVGCHGENGISTTEGVPHIGGQRSVYLYVEMKAYQSGSRRQTIMGNVVKYLNDKALADVAAYYATLDPPSPDTSAASLKPDPVEAGKAAAEACGGCHGETGVSKIAGIPSLVGLDPKYLISAMQAYKSG